MASDGGHIDATYRLGVLFDEGTKVEQDYTKSINYYQIAAIKRNEHALLRLAQFYHFGRGYIQDYTSAYRFYVYAAQEGSLLAQIAIKVTEPSTWDDKKTTLVDLPDELLFNYESCLLMWEYLAKNGDVDLQYKLGTLYEDMDGASNLSKAAAWYSKAVDNHHKDAMFRLGRFYQRGLGVDQNTEKAIDLYTKSEDGHHGDSLYQLGKLYLNYNQDESNPAQMTNYFEKAAHQGNSEAQRILGAIYEMRNNETHNVLHAIVWFTKSAEQGNTDAERNLGRIFEFCSTTYPVKIYHFLRHLVTRFRWYKSSHRSYYGSVYWMLGTIYYYGFGTSLNYKKAWDHFTKAKNLFQHEKATLILTLELENIRTSNIESFLKKLEMFESVQLFLTPEDLYNLGMVYYNGVYSSPSFEDEVRIIVDPDHYKALHYFKLVSGMRYDNIRCKY
jgi:TPR repeat protein